MAGYVEFDQITIVGVPLVLATVFRRVWSKIYITTNGYSSTLFLPVSCPPHAHHFPTDACRLFPNRLYLTSVPLVVRERPNTPNELCDTASNTKVNRLSGNKTEICMSPGAPIPHNANQTGKAGWVVYRLGREDEVIRSSRALKIERVPCTGKEAEAHSVIA